jgi:hypothetical protein
MKLYQYQPINKYTLQNLILQKIWGANPKSFNDPFEFVVRDTYRVKNDGEIERLSREEKEILIKIRDGISSFGVTCFSECEDSILLWSHYSSNHTGMCLTFEISDPHPQNLFKVEYDKVFPDITGDVKSDFFKYLITKGESWKYENERRLIFTKGVGHYEYPGPLAEITIGCKTDKVDTESIFKICDRIFENKVMLSKASIDLNSFLLSKETTYRQQGDPLPKHWYKK